MKDARTASTSARRRHPARWSFTSPIAWKSAYIVVGPTNRQPRTLSALDIAADAGTTAGIA